MSTLSAGIQRVRLDVDSTYSGRKGDAFAQIAADQSGDTLPFYPIETQILSLWDQLNELKLEKALLEAQVGAREPMTLNDEEISTELELAERQCLESRAEYMLRQSVVEDTMIASPVLNALHSGSNATGTERTLHPLLNRRDILEVASTNIASSLRLTIQETSKTAAANLASMHKNRTLAARLMVLTDTINNRTQAVIEQTQSRTRIEEMKKEAETSKKQWTLMKRVISAVIAGSGVYWAQDSVLTDLILDAENEEI